MGWTGVHLHQRQVKAHSWNQRLEVKTLTTESAVCTGDQSEAREGAVTPPQIHQSLRFCFYAQLLCVFGSKWTDHCAPQSAQGHSNKGERSVLWTAVRWGKTELAARLRPLYALALTKGLAQVSPWMWFCFHPDLCCLDKCIQMHLGAQRTRSGHVSAAAT